MASTCSPFQNLLLAAMPAEAQQRIFPHLELIRLPSNTALYEACASVSHVYFPIDSIISLEHVLESGATTGISMVGNEGMVGLASFMGTEFSLWRAVSQSAGFAYRMSGNRMKHEFDLHSDVFHLVLRYAQSRNAQIAQMAVCNRHHSIEQQLCRWLLSSLDRLPGYHLRMTQEHIGAILGVRREGVTVAANKLNRLGIIEYARGEITVLDRRTLECMTCECYEAVTRETDRLLPNRSKRKPVFSWADSNDHVALWNSSAAFARS